MPTFEQYQQQAIRTTNMTEAGPLRLCCWVLGVTGEAGEIAELVKKKLFHAHPIRNERIGEEIGDTLWYLAVLCEELGLNLEEIAQENLAKLEKRYPNGFTEADSLARRNLSDEEFAIRLYRMRGGKKVEIDAKELEIK